MKTELCQDDEYTVVRSDITGRDLIVNLSASRFLIPRTFNIEKVVSTCQLLYDALTKRDGDALLDSIMGSVGVRRRFHQAHLSAVARLANAASVDEFCSAVSALLQPTNSRSQYYIQLPAHVLMTLWRNDAIVWPRNLRSEIWKKQRRFSNARWALGPEKDPIRELIQEFETLNTQIYKAPRRYLVNELLGIILAIGGVRDITDLTPGVLNGRLRAQIYGKTLATNLMYLLNERVPVSGRYKIDDFGPFGFERKRSDMEFHWATERYPSVEQWRDSAARFLRVETRARATKCNAINLFLDYVIKEPTFPRDPVETLRATFEFPEIFSSGQADYIYAQKDCLRKLLATILVERCSEESDGERYIIPGFRNPINLTVVRVRRREQTSREAMPTRYLRMLREIIEEGEFAWPKSLTTHKGFIGDYFKWRDPESGEWLRIWNPVRAYAVLSKLLLPLRTFQVRMLNSGEADEQRFELASKSWIKNEHVLAGSDRERLGVLMRLTDRHDQHEYVGLYINTNKTADIYKDGDRFGYVIPWQNDDVILLYASLRQWQERYNPVTKRTPWVDLHEQYFTSIHRDVRKARGAETFLFRDACSRHPDQPVTMAKVSVFWYMLCGELERRLQVLGETTPDGKPIVLTKRGKGNVCSGAIYDLHSLRVSLLTSWAEQGVPIDILVQVAGHATAIMTLYYQKHSAAHITDMLNEANIKRALTEQQNWEQYVRSKRFEELKTIIAYNDLSGVTALHAGSGAGWVRNDYGICPVGCARCHEGAVIDTLKRRNRVEYGPVPGGAQNCVSCRFFITGPAFLIGLQAFFNDALFRYRQAGQRRAAAEVEFDGFDYLRKRAQDAHEPFSRLSEWETTSALLEQRTRELDILGHTLHGAYRLILQCQYLLNNPEIVGDGKFALVVAAQAEGVEIALEFDERGDREFELLDAVCQGATFFRSIDASKPNLMRIRAFDRMLRRNGVDVAFVNMSDEEALKVGNELAKFMFTQFRREDVNAVMAGKAMLRDLGIGAEQVVVEKIAGMIGRGSVDCQRGRVQLAT